MGLEKILGHLSKFIYGDIEKLSEGEQKKLTRHLDSMKDSVRKGDRHDLYKEVLKCSKYVVYVGAFKKPTKQVRKELDRQFWKTISYCLFYLDIKENLGLPYSTTMVIGHPEYPRAHALILKEDKITDLSIQFDYYSMIEKEVDGSFIGAVNVKPHLSKKDIEWNGDIGNVIDIVTSYKKENSVLLIVGGKDECPTKKEMDASTKFTLLYTGYLKEKQIRERKGFL